MPDPRPLDLAIVIVNWRVYAELEVCLRALPEALRREGGPELRAEIVVVDNESDATRLAGIRSRFPGVAWIVNAGNLGFAAACNQGIAATRSRHVLLLNPDSEPEPRSLAILVDYLDAHPRAAVAGPRLLNSSGAFERTCRRFPRLRYLLADVLLLSRSRALAAIFARYYYGEWDYASARAVDQVSGACFLMRRDAIESLGPLDERFFVYFEEVDWCLRARNAGLEVHYVPEARVRHDGGASSSQAREARVAYTHRSARAFYRKHHGKAAQAGLEVVLAMDRAGRAVLRMFARKEEPHACVDSPAS